MKFCQGLNKTDRLYDKLMEMDVHSWATAQNIIKNYSQSMALKADLVESAPRSQGHVVNQMLGSSGSAPRPAIRSPGGQRRKFDTDNRGSNKKRLRLLLPTKGSRARDRERVAPGSVGNVTRWCQETITSTTA